jgi:dTMP kinase
MPLITLEGIEGSGKSTQARRLAEALGPDTVLTFEPGATTLGADIRRLLLDKGNGTLAPDTELLLFFADRAQHLKEVIAPALAASRFVVCDRFMDSTLAYQGYGRQLGVDRIRAIARAVLGDLAPVLTLLLDVSVETGLARAGRRGAGDRIESERRAFHERVRAGFRELAAAEPMRWLVLDAEGEPDVVTQAMMDAVRQRGFLSHVVR